MIIIVTKETITLHDTSHRTVEAGSGIVFKYIDDKIIISAKNTTRIKEGVFSLEGKEIIIEGGKGVTISSRHPNILVIHANLSKVEEKILELEEEVNKRLEIIEKCFSKIMKQVKA